MAILFVNDRLTRLGGGSQIATLSWVKNLRKLGENVFLLCNRYDIQETEYVIKNPTIPLDFLVPSLELSLFFKKRILKIIQEYDIELIHLNEPSLLTYKMATFAHSHGIKTLCSFHTQYIQGKASRLPLSLFYKKNGFMNRAIEKFHYKILDKSNYLTAPTHFFKDVLAEKTEKKVFYLPYPITDSFFSKTPKKILPIPRKLITISRLSGEKNIDRLLEIMELVRDRYTLTIVGDGIDKKYLMKKVKKLHLQTCVDFVGWIDHEKLPTVLQQHDLFVSLSTFETFGITYIEALASGIPCIVPDYPVTQEIIPRSTALFMNNLETTMWAAQLMELQEDPQQYEKLVKSVQAHQTFLSRYHELQSAKQLQHIYKTILQS